jgi:predicted GH43/DUF377 family glycosyl hydrolase
MRNAYSLTIYICLSAICVCTRAEPPADLARWFAPQTWQRDVDGPVVSLGEAGQFDDKHIFAPAVVKEADRYWLWYSGSQGTPGNRVFRLGLATSSDGRRFERNAENPVLGFADAAHSVLTPALLRSGDGQVVREEGKLRMFFSSARLGKSGLHTLHQSRSSDGIHWDEPSPALLENVYCPSVLKTEAGYEMWFSDVSRRPWILRHAASADGDRWTVTPEPAVVLSQPWEAEVLTYPTVLKIDGVYVMWYGSYDRAIRRETTAIGFAASLDGRKWHKHPENPVLRPDPARAWESNYVGSGSAMRLADGSFRYWYGSRKAPPFLNLYFAINTAQWGGPATPAGARLIRLPPQKDDVGLLAPEPSCGRRVEVLEVVDDRNAIVRAWYSPPVAASGQEDTFLDLWIRGADTKSFVVDKTINLTDVFAFAGNQSINTTCGGRSFLVLEVSR